jgi:hypothetical protein
MPLPELGIIGYFLGLVVLVVFGIWGFRIGSNGPSRGNGGGSKRPRVEPRPPSGGHELADDDFQAWEKQFQASEQEPAGTRRD